MLQLHPNLNSFPYTQSIYDINIFTVHVRRSAIDSSSPKLPKTNKKTDNGKERLTELLPRDWSFHWDRSCRCRGVLKYSLSVPGPGAGGRAQGFRQAQIKCCLAKWFSKVDPVSGNTTDLEALPWR